MQATQWGLSLPPNDRKTADRLLRLIYVEHDRGNAPIRTTIQRINDRDSQDREQIIAEEAKGGWKTRPAA